MRGAHMAVSIIMKRSSAVALSARLFLSLATSSSMHAANEGMPRTHPEVVNYLFQTYEIENVIAEIYSNSRRYTQHPAMFWA